MIQYKSSSDWLKPRKSVLGSMVQAAIIVHIAKLKTNKSYGQVELRWQAGTDQSGLYAAHARFYHRSVKKTNPSSQTQIRFLI